MLWIRRFFLLIGILFASPVVMAQDSLTGIVIASHLKQSSYTYNLETSSPQRECKKEVVGFSNNGNGGIYQPIFRQVCKEKMVKTTQPMEIEQSKYYFNVLANNQVYHVSYQAFWTLLRKPLFTQGQTLNFSLNEKQNKMKITLENGKKIKAKVFKTEEASEAVIEKAKTLALDYTEKYEASLFTAKEMVDTITGERSK